MTSTLWTRCPQCGVQLKEANVDDHLARAHPAGARTEDEREAVVAKRRTLKNLSIAAVALLLITGVAVAGVVLLPKLGQGAQVSLTADGEPTIGSDEALVTIYVFEDHKCPYCRAFELDGHRDRLIERWVEPGHARLVYKDLAFIAPDSVTAARASQAIWRLAPELWPDWHDTVFENQGPEHEAWATQANLIEFTRQWGQVDMQAFQDELANGEHRAEVLEDIEEARQAGVQSTPTLVVGDRRVSALEPGAVDRAIQAALDEATAQATPAEGGA